MSNELFEYGGEVYVPIETAKLLKEAGFNWRVLMTYRDGVMTHQQHCLIDNYNHKMYQVLLPFFLIEIKKDIYFFFQY